jgi:hypothetical protein
MDLASNNRSGLNCDAQDDLTASDQIVPPNTPSECHATILLRKAGGPTECRER